MSRTLPKVPQASGVDSRAKDFSAVSRSQSSWRSNVWILRVALVVVFSAIAIGLSPFGLPHWSAALLGLLLSAAILFVEHCLRASSATALLGGAFGGLIGILAALLVSLVIAGSPEPESAKSFVEYSCLLGFGYVGVALGSEKAAYLKPEALRGLLRLPASPSTCSYGEGKLLDTSVLIDGRIADICEAHFLDGPLLVPQFVLHELQMIADSSDSLRRQRGRRGLEVLQRIQKIETLEVRIIEDNPHTSNEVDRKLVDLALRLRAKIVTNDFNLNKVASVQGISVLNVNLLANAVRPAFLPGEGMRVFILREGKEVNQGVAYLEDGTMVVVDGARRLINKTVDILVTSVHQTPAGKMIFGRLDDHSETPPGAKMAVGSRGSRSGLPDTSLE